MDKQSVYILKNIGTLERLREVLEEYQLYDTNDENVFFLYGYKTLHHGARETYRILKHMQISLKRNPVKISLEWLALTMGTSEEAQSSRIKQLERHSLIKIIKKPYQLNQYEILELLPDFTFVETVYKLIRRRMLAEQVNQLSRASDPVAKIDLYKNIENLKQLGATYHKSNRIACSLTE